MKLTTETLTDATRDLLQSCLPSFRYYKSFAHFRQVFGGGLSYITINTVTHGRGVYHLSFYLGVRHDAVEAEIRKILGLGQKLDHYSRTIWSYTVNIGPRSPHWQYAVRGSWDFVDLAELSQFAVEISGFVTRLAVPYLLEHEDVRAIRRTLLEKPGHAQNLHPYQQILTIDRILGDEALAARDFAVLGSRYERSNDSYRREFQDFGNRFFAREPV